MTWSRTWRLSMEWGSGFESSRSPLPNDPPRFPHLFLEVRENENGGMKETRMKSELFTSCLGEKIIFGMEIQKPADTAKCLPVFTSYFFTLYYSLFPTLLWASSAQPLVSPAGSDPAPHRGAGPEAGAETGSRKSATGARSPPPVRLTGYSLSLCSTGGGESYIV